MIADQSAETLRWRPHHIYCERFLTADFLGRGEKFHQVEQRIRETMKSGTNEIIEVIEGIDELCLACPLCQDDRCQSPNGDEVEVRKFDAIILKGLGISYGDRMTAQEFRSLIEDKAPLAFCRTRCRLKETCKVFEIE